MTHLHTGEGAARPHVPELVINWHFTEACNYSCRYCYAKWDRNDKELLHDWERSRTLLDELATFFDPDNAANPLRPALTWSGVRLNLAGGEPLLYPQAALRVLAYARSIGMNTSIITNGSRFTSELVSQLAPLVSMIGVSIDSVSAAVNTAIGRVDPRGLFLDQRQLGALLGFAKQIHPSVQIKINTVVNARNWHEDLRETVATLSPDRWKIFRMLPVLTSDLSVSRSQFDAFVERHECHKDVICAEDNEEMSESYLMIDPLGRFFQNTRGQQGYTYSRPIDAIGAGQAFRDWRFSIASFASRYGTAPI
jgi:radical S-adenosyl methionine domain-containing protein 2